MTSANPAPAPHQLRSPAQILAVPLRLTGAAAGISPADCGSQGPDQARRPARIGPRQRLPCRAGLYRQPGGRRHLRALHRSGLAARPGRRWPDQRRPAPRRGAAATQSFLDGFTVAMWLATAAVTVGLLAAAALARTGSRSAPPAGATSPAPAPGHAFLAGEPAPAALPRPPRDGSPRTARRDQDFGDEPGTRERIAWPVGHRR
jgi:hypothetical protein